MAADSMEEENAAAEVGGIDDDKHESEAPVPKKRAPAKKAAPVKAPAKTKAAPKRAPAKKGKSLVYNTFLSLDSFEAYISVVCFRQRGGGKTR